MLRRSRGGALAVVSVHALHVLPGCSSTTSPRGPLIPWGESSCEAVAARCETADSCARALQDLRGPEIKLDAVLARMDATDADQNDPTGCSRKIRRTLSEMSEATLRGPFRQSLESPDEAVSMFANVALALTNEATFARATRVLPYTTVKKTVETLSKYQTLYCYDGKEHPVERWIAACAKLRRWKQRMLPWLENHPSDPEPAMWAMFTPALQMDQDASHGMILLSHVTASSPVGFSRFKAVPDLRWSSPMRARDWRYSMLRPMLSAYYMNISSGKVISFASDKADDARDIVWSGVVLATWRMVVERAQECEEHQESCAPSIEAATKADARLRAMASAWVEHGISSPAFRATLGRASHGYPGCREDEIQGEPRALYKNRMYVASDPDMVNARDAFEPRATIPATSPGLGSETWGHDDGAFRHRPWKTQWAARAGHTWVLADGRVPKRCDPAHCGPNSGPPGLIVTVPGRAAAWVGIATSDPLERVSTETILRPIDTFLAPLGEVHGRLLLLAYRAEEVSSDLDAHPLKRVIEDSSDPVPEGLVALPSKSSINPLVAAGYQDWVPRGGAIVQLRTETDPPWLEKVAELPGSPFAATLTEDQQVLAITSEGGVLVDPSDGHVRMLPCR